jgi:hypothetical protein
VKFETTASRQNSPFRSDRPVQADFVKEKFLQPLNSDDSSQIEVVVAFEPRRKKKQRGKVPSKPPGFPHRAACSLHVDLRPSRD